MPTLIETTANVIDVTTDVDAPSADVDAPDTDVPEEEPERERELVFELRDLEVQYSGHTAVREVDLDIAANEITAFIGPSGCGKTTVLRCLNRMHDITPGAKVIGQVTYHGENLYASKVDAAEVRRRIGMVFQKPNPFPKTIFDNVAYGPKINGRKRSELADIVEHALTRAALWDEVKDKLKHSGLSLSGGQQQRLCIARAIAVEPDVVLMDEPCSALDPIATARIEDLMEELKERVHDRDRHAQHAAGRARVRPHGVLHRRGRRRGPAGRSARRVRRHREAVHRSGRSSHRGLHHGTVRLMS